MGAPKYDTVPETDYGKQEQVGFDKFTRTGPPKCLHLYVLLRITVCVYLILWAGLDSVAVTITGKIRNYDGKSQIRYSPTVEGVLVPFASSVQPSKSGDFTIQFTNEGYGTTIISFNRLVYRIFHRQDSRVHLEIDQASIQFPKIKRNERRFYAIADSVKQLSTVNITGDFAQINQLYNRLPHTSFYTTRSVSGTYISLKMQGKVAIPALIAFSDSLLNVDLKKIEALPITVTPENPNAELESKFVKSFLENEVRSFYGSNLLNSILLRRLAQYQQNRVDSTQRQDIYNEEWMDFVQRYAADLRSRLQSYPASRDYQEVLHQLNYTAGTYRDLEFSQTMKKSLDEMVVDEIFNYDTTLYKDEKIVFAYQLDMLNRYIQDPMFYSPVLLQAMYILQQKYPHSDAIKHYDEDVVKLERYLSESLKDFREARFINKRFDSLTGLLASLKGETLLIDVWATWCQPCIQDFSYKENIQPFIDEGKLSVLYLSIDKNEWSDRWKRSVRFNKLAGYHYRADEHFIKNMWATLKGWQGAIPRYALIDKEGRIVNPDAPRPGSDGKLVKEIEALLAGN